MTLVIKCEDRVDIPVDSIDSWPIKDLVQDGVLYMPFTSDLVSNLIYIQENLEELNLLDTDSLKKVYKLAHFIGLRNILSIMKSIAFREGNEKFLVYYLEVWNIDELNTVSLTPKELISNINLTIILYHLINQGLEHLRKLYLNCIQLGIPSGYPLFVYNQVRNPKRVCQEIINSVENMNLCIGFQEYFSNEYFYMADYATLVSNEKSLKVKKNESIPNTIHSFDLAHRFGTKMVLLDLCNRSLFNDQSSLSRH